MKPTELPRIIDLPRIYDPRGCLSFTQNDDGLIPFDIQRVYWIYDVPAGSERGAHSHRKTKNFLVALAGSFCVKLFDGKEWQSFTLNRPFKGLYIPPGYWHTMDNFASGSVCMVIASTPYDESDYIREYREFLDSVK